MGAAESRSLTSTSSDSSIRGRIGFHVLRVATDSPASDAGIEPFFDYVVGVAGTPLTANMAEGQQGTGNVEEMLARVVDEHEGRELSLQVWSSKRTELREVVVLPSRHWSSVTRHRASNGESVSEVSLDEIQPSLLGLSLRLCNPDGALQNVWHVLELLEGSPAESAGLVPFGDYILGYSGGVLHKESDFYKLIEDHVDQPLRLFVYNSDFDVTREVVIVPNRAWSSTSSGGSGEGGLLGCGVGFGVLHRIPKPEAKASETANGDNRPLAPPQPMPASTVPKRMTASVAPSTPPKPSASAFRSQQFSPSSPNRGAGGMYGLSAPPRSPGRNSPRGSFAESIIEEEESLA